MPSEVLEHEPTTEGIVRYHQPTEVSLLTPAEKALVEANEIVVDSLAMRDIATAEMNLNKGAVKNYESDQKELTGDLLKHLERLRSLFRRPKELREEAVKVYERKIIAFNREQELARQREQERLADIARREQARQREEAARVEAKAQADAEAIRKQAAEAKAAGDAGRAAQLETRAEAKVEAGANRAAAINTMADAAPIAPILAAAPKMGGAHETARWGADPDEPIDMALLVPFIAANPMYLNLLKPDTTAINALARSLRENFKIPGIKAKKEIGLTKSRGA